VGSDFKINFFKRSLNFCYEKNKGIIFSDDLKVLDKLGIDKALIEETYLEKNEVFNELIISQQKNKEKIENLEAQIKKLFKDKSLLGQITKEIVNYQKETQIQEEEKETQQNEIVKILKTSTGILNKKYREINETIEVLKIKMETIMESIDSKQSVNIFGPGVTVEHIWNSMKDKNTAAILSIMFMMKKFFEGKGLRF